MILTETQRKILFSTVMQANASVSEIARALKIREHIVRRSIDLFHDNGVFSRRCVFLDPIALGLGHFSVFISLPLNSAHEKKKLREVLSNAQETTAIYELSGDPHIELRLYARSHGHLSNFLEELAKAFPHPLRIHSVNNIVEHEYSGVSHPEVPSKARPLLRYGPLVKDQPIPHINELDHSILYALSNQHYLNFRQVSLSLSISNSTLLYRIAHLEKVGIIKGHYYIIDVKVFNDLPILIRVCSRILTEAQKAAFLEFCRRHPRIAWVTTFTGTYAAEILTRVSSYDEAHAVVDDLSRYFNGIIDSTQMTPLLHFFKFTPYPFRDYTAFTGA